MFASEGESEVYKFTDNFHPTVLPPPSPWFFADSPRQFGIPYFQASSIPSSAIGSCCGNGTGFLGDFNFSLLNSPAVNASSYETLGQYPATDFSFNNYASEDELYSMLEDTFESGWIGALVFREFDVSSNRYHIGLVRNITIRGAQSTVGTLNLIDNAMLLTATQGGRSLVVRLKVQCLTSF